MGFDSDRFTWCFFSHLPGRSIYFQPKRTPLPGPGREDFENFLPADVANYDAGVPTANQTGFERLAFGLADSGIEAEQNKYHVALVGCTGSLSLLDFVFLAASANGRVYT